MISRVDAFVDYDLGMLGNPAGVCILDDVFYTKEKMQGIAALYNWSETCFVLKCDKQKKYMEYIKSIWPNHAVFQNIDKNFNYDNVFCIRWFSPKDEAPLCGHATLAACYLIFSQNICKEDETINMIFSDGFIKSYYNKDKDMVYITMPTKSFDRCEIDPEPYLGIKHDDVVDVMSDDTLCFFVVKDDDTVSMVIPNHEAIIKTRFRAMAVTSLSSGSGIDFCSRYFAPSVGIYEDPVCGSLHCRLAKYWSIKTGKVEMVAQQLSNRGGILHVEYRDNYVVLGGKCGLI